MTIRRFSAEEAKNSWLSLERRPDHPLDCNCDSCIYFSQPKKPRYSRRTFYIASLIHRIKLDYLIENKKARRIRYRGKWTWFATNKVYDEAPFKNRLRRILSDVYDLTGDDDLPDPSSCDSIANYIKRSGAAKFIIFKDNILLTRQRLWIDTKPTISKKWKENLEAARFCQRIVNFIRLKPKQETSQRDLLRHFSNKRKADLENAFKWLWFFPNIKRSKKGKSIIYTWIR